MAIILCGPKLTYSPASAYITNYSMCFALLVGFFLCATVLLHKDKKIYNALARNERAHTAFLFLFIILLAAYFPFVMRVFATKALKAFLIMILPIGTLYSSLAFAHYVWRKPASTVSTIQNVMQKLLLLSIIIPVTLVLGALFLRYGIPKIAALTGGI